MIIMKYNRFYSPLNNNLWWLFFPHQLERRKKKTQREKETDRQFDRGRNKRRVQPVADKFLQK